MNELSNFQNLGLIKPSMSCNLILSLDLNQDLLDNSFFKTVPFFKTGPNWAVYNKNNVDAFRNASTSYLLQINRFLYVIHKDIFYNIKKEPGTAYLLNKG